MRWIILFGLLWGSLPVNAQADEDFAPVVIAKQPLPRGFMLTEERVFGENSVVGLAFYPAESIPATALQNLAEVVGRVIRTDIPREQALIQHYLLDLDPFGSSYPISPPDYRLTQAFGDFLEVTTTELAQIQMPARLAAGDRVALVSTSVVGNFLVDETSVVAQNLVVAQLTADSLSLSVPAAEAERISTLLTLPLTIVIQSDESPTPPVISWDYLTTRDENPVVIPNGANLSRLGN